MLIFPDHKITAQQKSRIGYTVKIIVGSALDTCREDDAPVFLGRFTRYYNNPERYDDGSALRCSIPCFIFRIPFAARN